MSVSAVPFNPFRAPEVEPEVVAKVPKDLSVPYGEFRIYGKGVYISSDVEFPPICIRTGDTSNLIRRTAEVQFTGPVDVFLSIVTVLLCYPILIAFVALAGFVARSFPAYYWEMAATVIMMLCGASGVFANKLSKQLSSLTRIHYYESKQWRMSWQRKKRFWFFTAYSAVCGAFFVVWYADGALFVLLIAIVMPLVWFIKTPPFTAIRLNSSAFLLARMPVEFLRDHAFCDVVSQTESSDKKHLSPPPRWAAHIEL